MFANLRYFLLPVLNITGPVLIAFACLLLLPVFVSNLYNDGAAFGFEVACVLCLVTGLLLYVFTKRHRRELLPRDGFLLATIIWTVTPLFGAIPLMLEIPGISFTHAYFESMSGITTTCATVLSGLSQLPESINFWRCLMSWIGGMGILVLVLAIIPKNTDATTMNIFKAEVPGHQVEKFTDKLTLTAKILYLIYTGMTIILAVSFIIADMPVFDSIVHSMSIAGTGGFSIKNASLGAYNSVAIEIIATVGMFMFGVNMNIFYLILIGKFTTAIRSEELRTYTILFVVAILTTAGALTINKNYESFGESLRYSSFQIASIMSTTGMYVEDFSTWTALCQAIIFMLMFIGGCSGSTAGGMKISRIMIAGKYARIQYYRAARPNRIKTLRLEGERLEGATIASTMSFLGLYIGTVLISLVLVALFDDIFISDGGNTFTEKLTAVVSCMSNVGPGFGRLAVGTYNGFSPVSKLILSFDMLAGRLEILPMLFLFNPMAWRLKS